MKVISDLLLEFDTERATTRFKWIRLDLKGKVVYDMWFGKMTDRSVSYENLVCLCNTVVHREIFWRTPAISTRCWDNKCIAHFVYLFDAFTNIYRELIYKMRSR